ncbi:MAG: hypothetical protein JSV21_05335 [Nitrospirota bacterium]|nr:MAG: hypothetical protein JSV21_05335 [Nitrospirota bacterium]
MGIEVRRTLKGPGWDLKIEIFRREDDSFGFQEMGYGFDDNKWYPTGRYLTGYFASEQEALREVRNRVSWLQEF